MNSIKIIFVHLDNSANKILSEIPLIVTRDHWNTVYTNVDVAKTDNTQRYFKLLFLKKLKIFFRIL